MFLNWNVTLVEVPNDKKISILKAVRSLTGLGLKESKDLIESAPVSLVKTSIEEEAKKFELELERAGAIVIVVEMTAEETLSENFQAGENLTFLEAMQQINERVSLLRKEEVTAQEVLATASQTLSEVQQQFKQLSLELEKVGLVAFNEEKYQASNEQKIVELLENIVSTKIKLAEGEEARLKRHEESKKGLWSKIKSSVGNIFDMIETYREQLTDNYVNLAKLIITSDEESETLNQLCEKDLINKVREISKIQYSAENVSQQANAEKIKVNLEIGVITKTAQKNIHLCASLNELQTSLDGFDPELGEIIKKYAEKVIPQEKPAILVKDYPHAKNTIGGEVALIDDYVVISHGTVFKVLNFFDQDANLVKIPVESITVISFKESGIFDGTLEFVYLGYFPKPNEKKHNQENVITFRGKECNEKFKAFKEIVEKRMREVKQKPASSASPSAADELAKFAMLHKEGVISDEEFTALKRKLMGL